jgi:hypothetical protein
MVKESSNVTKSFIAVMLLGIVIISINNILSTQMATHIKIMWSIVILGLCAAIILLLTKFKTSAMICMAITAAIAIITLMLQANVVGYCGDNICSREECSIGCGDCQASQCENRICERPIENCGNSVDCRFSHGYACAPLRNNSNVQGCMLISCGDGFCDTGESTVTCCTDCGCPAEHTCRDRACYFTPPAITLNTKMIDTRISVTTLVADPLLTDVNGTPRPLVGLFFDSPNYIRDLQLNFSLGGHQNESILIGDIPPNNKLPILWYAKERTHLLTIIEDRKINVSITAIYKDVTGEQRTQTWNYPIMLLGRNTPDKQGTIILFLTRDYMPKASTPEGIWAELQTLVDYEQRDDNGNKIYFSKETLTRGKGNRNDLAVLIASAYDTKNLTASIVESYDGYFIRVRTKNKFVILDPAKIDESFQDAIVTRPGSAVYDINIERIANNYSIISINDSLIPALSVKYNSTSFQTCPCDTYCWTKASAEHTITNTGISPAQICATSRIFGKDVLDEKKECYEIDAQSSIIMRHGWTSAQGCVAVNSTLNVVVK